MDERGKGSWEIGERMFRIEVIENIEVVKDIKWEK